MFKLIGTRVLRAGYSGAATFSVAAHTALIAMAVVPFASSASRTHGIVEPRTPAERVRVITFTPRPLREFTKTPTRSTVASRAARKSSLALLKWTPHPVTIDPIELPNLNLDSAFADIDLTAKVADSLDFSGRTLAEVISDAFRIRTARSVNGVYDSESVSRIVNPYPNNPKPAYPRWLQETGVEAEISAHFVVDSTGRVVAKSIKFDTSAHPLFMESIKRALQRSRYLPAEIDGKRVAQLVSQQFAFRIVR